MDEKRAVNDRDLPVWARSDAFPLAGEGWGWIDWRGKRSRCESISDLEKVMLEDKRGEVRMVWTPEHPYCVVPEEVDVLQDTTVAVRKKWAREDSADAYHRLKVLGAGFLMILGYMVYEAWSLLGRLEISSGLSLDWWFRLKWMFGGLVVSTSLGIAMLVLLVFGFIPWYGAWKRSRKLLAKRLDPKAMVPALRFETWLEMQNAPMTRVVLGLLLFVFAAQVFADSSFLVIGDSLHRAGMVKPLYLSGEHWRILTAPMMHGGVLHFGMNAFALLYLGKRLEVFAGWPHMPAVFLFSALVGGEATARVLDAPSVGASGGLMGLLGFLLVFETLHARLVPMSSRRRLLGGLALTLLIGLVGYRFIDNAAHAGGLVAGMGYAGIVFPKSSSVERPKMNVADRLLGVVTMMMLFSAAGLAVWRICM